MEAAAAHLSAPGVEGGATLNQYKNLFQVNVDSIHDNSLLDKLITVHCIIYGAIVRCTREYWQFVCGEIFNVFAECMSQGLFMAPSIVGESLKGAELLAQVMQNELGYPCFPPPGSFRTDIIQAVKLGSRKKVSSLTAHAHVEFC